MSMLSPSPVWVLLDDTQMASSFSAGNWVTAGAGTGPWLGNTSTFIGTPGGDIILSFQGTSISLVGNTPSSTNSPTWFLVGIDSNTPYNVSFPYDGTQVYAQWYQTPMLSDGLHSINLSSIVVNLDYAIITAGQTTPLTGSTILVDDSMEEITYTGNGWVDSQVELNFGPGWVNGPPLGNTTHQTSTIGDGFEFRFTGSNISVYCVFKWNATGSISIDLTLDGQTTSSSLFVPSGTTSSHTETPQYLFFSAGDIEAGNHTLLMNVTQAVGSQSFAFDYLTYQPSFSTLVDKPNFNSSLSTSTSSATSSSASSTATSSSTSVASTMKGNHVGAIVGGVVGGLALILAGILFLMCRGRKQKKNLGQPSTAAVYRQPEFVSYHTNLPTKSSNSTPAAEASEPFFSPYAGFSPSEPVSRTATDNAVDQVRSDPVVDPGSSSIPDMTQVQIDELRRRIDDLASRGSMAPPPAYANLS